MIHVRMILPTPSLSAHVHWAIDTTCAVRDFLRTYRNEVCLSSWCDHHTRLDLEDAIHVLSLWLYESTNSRFELAIKLVCPSCCELRVIVTCVPVCVSLSMSLNGSGHSTSGRTDVSAAASSDDPMPPVSGGVDVTATVAPKVEQPDVDDGADADPPCVSDPYEVVSVDDDSVMGHDSSDEDEVAPQAASACGRIDQPQTASASLEPTSVAVSDPPSASGSCQPAQISASGPAALVAMPPLQRQRMVVAPKAAPRMVVAPMPAPAPAPAPAQPAPGPVNNNQGFDWQWIDQRIANSHDYIPEMRNLTGQPEVTIRQIISTYHEVLREHLLIHGAVGMHTFGVLSITRSRIGGTARPVGEDGVLRGVGTAIDVRGYSTYHFRPFPLLEQRARMDVREGGRRLRNARGAVHPY